MCVCVYVCVCACVCVCLPVCVCVFPLPLYSLDVCLILRIFSPPLFLTNILLIWCYLCIFYVMYVALCATSVEADVHNLRVTILMKICLFFGGYRIWLLPKSLWENAVPPSNLASRSHRSALCSILAKGQAEWWKSSINGTWVPRVSDESKLGREFGMKTPSILANSSVLRDIMSKTRRSMSWYRMNGTHWRGIKVTYSTKRTRLYITRMNIIRKLPRSSVVVTRQEEDSRIHLQHRSGPFKA